MDKPNWNSSTLIQPNELSSYLHPNWDTPIDHSDPFESGLSSIVSSPAASGAGSGAGHGGMIREVIGRLGSICDSGEISPHSPPRLNLSSLSEAQIRGNFPISGTHFPNLVSLNADPGFVERAAKYSCFGSGDLGQFGGNEVPNLQSGMLSRVSSNQSIKNAQGNHKSGPFQSVNCGVEKNYNGVSRPTTPENGELGDSREGSSVSEQSPGGEIGLKSQNDANSRKRKSTPTTKGKDEKQVEAENEESNAKRSKADEEGKNVNEEPNGEREKETKPEPPKDYIHVRARRGQATDSHSLAERVRREKISERMKFLQELVPGCSKVTGKATVLDEIINYVQALQRQVEFLSMKLATVNPRADFNMEALLSKDIFQSHGPLSQTMFPLDASAPALAYGYEPHQQMPPLVGNVSNKPECPFSMNPLNGAMRENSGIQLPSLDGFGGGVTQMPPFWDSDLESIVQMGLAQNHTQSVPGTLPTNQMKVEL